jgi:hypothetical protein
MNTEKENKKETQFLKEFINTFLSSIIREDPAEINLDWTKFKNLLSNYSLPVINPLDEFTSDSYNYHNYFSSVKDILIDILGKYGNILELYGITIVTDYYGEKHIRYKNKKVYAVYHEYHYLL